MNKIKISGKRLREEELIGVKHAGDMWRDESLKGGKNYEWRQT